MVGTWTEHDAAYSDGEAAQDDRDLRDRARWLDRLERRQRRGEQLTDFEREQLEIG